MNLVAGLMWGALGGLTRDMSPRVSRARPSACSRSARSAAFFCGTSSAVRPCPSSAPGNRRFGYGDSLDPDVISVLLWLKDLHPTLRLTIVESETTVLSPPPNTASDDDGSSGERSRGVQELLSRGGVGAVSKRGLSDLCHHQPRRFSVMFNRAFHYSPAGGQDGVVLLAHQSVHAGAGRMLSDQAWRCASPWCCSAPSPAWCADLVDWKLFESLPPFQ